MTREEQKKFKELRKAVPKILQPYIKQYKFKKKDNTLWCVKGEMFFNLSIWIGENDGNCFCYGNGIVKPLWADDMLWDIIGMESNKEQPLSLRGTGAFTLYGAEIYKEKILLDNWELSEAEEVGSKIIENFYEIIQQTNMEDFYLACEKTLYQKEIMDIIVLIHNGEYTLAKEKITQLKSDYFVNENKGFGEWAVEYIEKINVKK